VRIKPLLTLDADAEALLRERAAEKGRDSASSLRQIGAALAARKAEAVSLYDDANRLRGIAAWRWADRAQSHAQVLMLHTESSAPAALGEALTDYVFSELARVVSLQVIEARLRDHCPGVRESWQRHGLAIFERCQMVRPLGVTPLPIVPVPDGYRLAPWPEDRPSDIEQVAAAAYRAGIESIAVPDLQGNRAVETLRRRRGSEGWHPDLSLVVLDRHDGSVIGYLAALSAHQDAEVGDLAVHPAHRRRGLARLMMARCMMISQRLGHGALTLSVTSRNPARTLYNQLGFQPLDCGEVAIWWRDGRHAPWRA